MYAHVASEPLTYYYLIIYRHKHFTDQIDYLKCRAFRNGELQQRFSWVCRIMYDVCYEFRTSSLACSFVSDSPFLHLFKFCHAILSRLWAWFCHGPACMWRRGMDENNTPETAALWMHASLGTRSVSDVSDAQSSVSFWRPFVHNCQHTHLETVDLNLQEQCKHQRPTMQTSDQSNQNRKGTAIQDVTGVDAEAHPTLSRRLSS